MNRINTLCRHVSLPGLRTNSTNAAAKNLNLNAKRAFAGSHLPQNHEHDRLLENKKVLIANRGEIAIRISKAAKALGLQSVAIYAPEDKESPHLTYADEAVELPGRETAIAPYLDIPALTNVAKERGVNFVHPGYGFLSESADFANSLRNVGVTWVGPSPEVLRLFGDKTKARELAIRTNVPVVRGSDNLISAHECLSLLEQDKVSLPAIMKAAYGGGGRGMRIVRSLSDVESNFNACKREAKTAFGRDEVFIEEFWENTKHLEVQIIADGTGGTDGVVHLYERDCTVQNRHQKVIELAPARNIHPDLRKRLLQCAITMARESGYKGAGTVEFLVRGDLESADTKFVFMELNPRVQVEHTVTEEATGIDIVQTQLLIAGGRSLKDLNLSQDNIGLRKHSCQARITMMPGAGVTLTNYQEPQGEGVRCDSAGWYTGLSPNQMYDPLVGKLICSVPNDESFEGARNATLKALDEFKIEGISNNIDAVKRILTHPDFVANKVNTSFLVEYPELLNPKQKGAGAKKPIEQKPKEKKFSNEVIQFELKPPMTGNILEVKMKVGDPVEVGETVVVMSAMKLETEMQSQVKGKILSIRCKEGEQVAGDQVLAVIEGVEEIEEIDIPSTSAQSGGAQLGAGNSGGLHPSIDVWRSEECSVEDFLNGQRGGLSVIKNLPKAQLEDAKALEREKRNLALKEELAQKLQEVKLGGGEKAKALHEKRNKLLPRDRITRITDPGSAFLEIGALAGGDGLYAADGIDNLPSAGMVCGIGLVNGREVLFVANDATVKGGTYFPITVKKHLRAQQIALENKLPCVYLVDSGGAFLPKQADVFPDRNHFGRIFFNQATMSNAGIPQISCVLGSCTAGGAYVPAMSDESVIVKGNGTIFLAGPPLVKAATNETVTAEELGGADVHTSISGVADHFAPDEASALNKVREIISSLPQNYDTSTTVGGNGLGSNSGANSGGNLSRGNHIEEPLYPLADLHKIIPEDNRIPFDVRQILARVLDGSRFHEFKARFGTSIVCGFGNLHGLPVGIVANNGILFSESSLKATHFIQLCGQRKVPILFVQNITGFMVGKQYENEGIAKNGAKLVTAVSCAPVPKLTLIVGGSHGAGNYGMCGRAYDPRFMFTWPNSRISVMGGPQAASVLSTVKNEQIEKQTGKGMTKEEIEAFEKPYLEKYEREGSPYFATSRLWDDGVIQIEDTRKVLGQSLRIVSKNMNTEVGKGTYGVFRT